MKILINDKIEKNLWNKFSGTNTFHNFEWLEIIHSIYNLEPYYILAYKNNDFALLPAFRIKNSLLSLPYLGIVGFLSNSSQLLEYLNKFIMSQSLTINYKYATTNISENSTVTAIVNVEDKELFWKNLSSKMRNQIRKSLKNNLNIKREIKTDNFFHIYSLKMHKLGTPLHPEKFFKMILKKINKSFIYTTFFDDVPVASMLCIITNDIINKKIKTLNIMWAATLSEYDKYYPNYFLYYKVMKIFMDKGIYNFDLGTCKINSNQYKFKKKWKPCFYAIHSTENKKEYKDDRKMIFLSNLWKKLPLPVANFLGPKVRKYLK